LPEDHVQLIAMEEMDPSLIVKPKSNFAHFGFNKLDKEEIQEAIQH
jgi:hypothetical protein